MAYEEPTVIWESDRSFGDKKEKLQLELGEYNGRPTFTLRQLFETENGWRWARAREDRNGRCWAAMNLREKELASLAEALMKAAGDGHASVLRKQAEGKRLDKSERGQAVAAAASRGGDAPRWKRKESAPAQQDFADIDDDDVPF